MRKKVSATINLNNQVVPATQAMQYTIERAQKAIGWLKEVHKESEKEG